MASMNELVDELFQIQAELRDFIDKSRQPEIEDPLQKLRDVAEDVGQAWSGSCLGYHAHVYYSQFQPPPPGAHFSTRWGLRDVPMSAGTRGDWCQYEPDEVRTLIYKAAGDPDLSLAHDLGKEGLALFNEKRSEMISILETVLSGRQDTFINGLKEQTEKEQVFTAANFIEVHTPRQIMTNDPVAVEQGIWVAPHLSVLSEVFALQNPTDQCEHLADIAKRAASHLKRVEKSTRRSEMIGTNVFIGHGGSLIWRELKDFIEDRLNLPCDEFNRVPIAGITNIDRLAEMLDAAAIGFLILTGEDEQSDGTLHARMNVVHEAGLFQGRLGFRRAIVLLEEGCEGFSNIEGLGQIRFPKGKIKAAFEEVRQVLEREGVISI